MGISESPNRARALLIINLPALFHIARDHNMLFFKSELQAIVGHFRQLLQRQAIRYELDVVVFRINRGLQSESLARKWANEGLRVFLVDKDKSTVDREIWDYLQNEGHRYEYVALAGGQQEVDMGQYIVESGKPQKLLLYSFFIGSWPTRALRYFDRAFNLFQIFHLEPRPETGLEQLEKLLAKQAC